VLLLGFDGQRNTSKLCRYGCTQVRQLIVDAGLQRGISRSSLSCTYWVKAVPTCFRLLRQLDARAFSRALAKTGRGSPRGWR